MLGIGDVDRKISDICLSPGWGKLVDFSKAASSIVIAGHGGNLAVADHIAVDIARLTGFSKSTFCPGSAINSSSFINDSSFEDWLISWFKSLESCLKPSATTLVGISSSGKSVDVINLLSYGSSIGYTTTLISASPVSPGGGINVVYTDCQTYHESEVVSLALGYQLISDLGFTCPSISS